MNHSHLIRVVRTLVTPIGVDSGGASGKKNPLASALDIRDASSIPGWGRYHGGGHGDPLLYSCLENSMDRGTWWATVHGVTQSQT